MKKTVVCLTGPTAVGKTDVALVLAKRISAEIISCDSMQVYQGIDIASSKPTKKQRRLVPHHLIDIKTPTQEYNAASFRSSALKLIKSLHNKGRLPLIVGGTGLYLRALLDGLFSGPGQDLGLRRKFYRQARKYGVGYLYRRLKVLDPQSALKIHPHDLRRIVRALEVYHNSGIPISKLKRNRHGIRDEYRLYIFGLQRPREQLYARIEQRVERMFRRGLVAEIRKLTRFKLSKTVRALLGYKEVKGFLDGQYMLPEANRLLKRNTRRYAKRQLSWFRKEKGLSWIKVGLQDSPEVVVDKILTLLPKI